MSISKLVAKADTYIIFSTAKVHLLAYYGKVFQLAFQKNILTKRQHTIFVYNAYEYQYITNSTLKHEFFRSININKYTIMHK